METQNLLNDLLVVVIIPLLGILTKYIVAFLQSKIDDVRATKEIKDNQILSNAMLQIEKSLSKCIDATTQSFVSELKKNGTFTEDNFEKAFKITKDNFMKTLTEEKKEIIKTVYTDIDVFIRMYVESYLKENK